MANRRKFIAGLGALATSSAAALGTGAFSSVEAERSVSVEVGGDNNAYLGLRAERDDIISDDGDGQLSLDLGSQTTDKGGEGFNKEAVTEIEGVFRITNQGTEEVGTGFATGSPVMFQNLTDEIEPVDGVTLTVQNSQSFDGGVQAAVLSSGDSTLVDVEVDTDTYSPQDATDGSVTIGAYVEDF